MFIHFSIMLIITKRKGVKFDQKSYDFLFNNIENNLRELGFGDVTVNKKMKDLNKILYDILLKININDNDSLRLNKKLIIKYFSEFEEDKTKNYSEFESYFEEFYNFCFELPLDNMIRSSIKFNYNYGSS